MRFMLTITMPHGEFNAAVSDGSAGEKIQRILDDCQPEDRHSGRKYGGRFRSSQAGRTLVSHLQR